MSNKKLIDHSPAEVEPNNPPPTGAGAVAVPPNENPPVPPAEGAAGTAGAPNPLNGGGLTAGFWDAEGGVEGAPPPAPKEKALGAGAGVVGALAGVVVP